MISYAVDHSTNALRRRRRDAATTEDVVFDWLTRLVEDFEAVPTGKVRLDGNALWVSRRVVANLDAVERRAGSRRVDDVREVRAWLGDGRERPVTTSLASVLKEMDFAGKLFERLVVDPAFDFGPTFGARRCLVSRLLRHAETNGRPLALMAVRHAHAFSGGRSMRPPLDEEDRDAPPWTRTWNAAPEDVEEVERLFSSVLGPNALTRAGQRRLALRILREGDSETGASDSERRWTRAAWTLAAGGDVETRRRLARELGLLGLLDDDDDDGNDDGEKNGDASDEETRAWASFLVPWIDPSVFLNVDATERERCSRDATRYSKNASRDATRSFFVAAAALDAAPEGHECGIETWTGSEEDLRALARDRPHLAHVVEKTLRYGREHEPPEWMISRAMGVGLASHKLS